MSSDKIHRPGNRLSSWWSWLGHREAVWRCLWPGWRGYACSRDSQSSWRIYDTKKNNNSFTPQKLPSTYQYQTLFQVLGIQERTVREDCLMQKEISTPETLTNFVLKFQKYYMFIIKKIKSKINKKIKSNDHKSS